ncbi:hypothetical protein ACFXG4_39190 [Nocardia sp. NPDC059246]
MKGFQRNSCDRYATAAARLLVHARMLAEPKLQFYVYNDWMM